MMIMKIKKNKEHFINSNLRKAQKWSWNLTETKAKINKYSNVNIGNQWLQDNDAIVLS